VTSLADVVRDAAAGVASPIEPTAAADGSVGYERGERLFAVLEPAGDGASVRLAEAVAAAALRTPDTSASDRGRGWVTLRPATLDGHARDRAVAWFESAWRAAAD
jgi:hypothetical protein